MQISKFKSIGIIGKYEDNVLKDVIDSLLKVTNDFSINVYLDDVTLGHYSDDYSGKSNISFTNKQCLVDKSDLIIAIGGDGSFLGNSRIVVRHNKPITGINMGRLGFLTDIYPHEIEILFRDILLGDYQEEHRTVLSAEIVRDNEVIEQHIAINDVVIKTSLLKMIELDVYIDDVFLSVYRADGLIVSSPTGSTAYALSSGGPILQASLDALVLLPISPHTLTQRPIVISNHSKVSVCTSKHYITDVSLTFDGQNSFTLLQNDVVNISEYSEKLKLYHPKNYDSLKRFRDKLGWGNYHKLV